MTHLLSLYKHNIQYQKHPSSNKGLMAQKVTTQNQANFTNKKFLKNTISDFFQKFQNMTHLLGLYNHNIKYQNDP